MTPILDTNGVIRQVLAAETFVDVASSNAFQYEVRFYAPSSRAAMTTNGFYGVTGNPFVVWHIANPGVAWVGGELVATNASRQLTVTEIRGATRRSWDYTYVTNDAETGWVLLSGRGLRSESKISTHDPVSGNRIEQRIVTGPGGQCVSEQTMEFHAFAWGERKVREQDGQAGNGLDTGWNYYGDAGNSGRYGRVSSVAWGDGRQRSFDYDLGGRKISVADPWKDGAADQIVEEYDYAPVDNRDVPDAGAAGDAKKPRTTTRKVNGLVVTRSYAAYVKANGAKTIIEEQAGAVDALYGDARNRRTATTYYSTNEYSYWSGRVQSIERSDGTLETHVYAKGDYVAAGNEPGMFVEGEGTCVQEVVLHGTTAVPEGIPNKSTRDVRVYDVLGRLLLEETHIDTAGGPVRVAWVVNKYDDLSHLTDAYRSPASGVTSRQATNKGLSRGDGA